MSRTSWMRRSARLVPRTLAAALVCVLGQAAPAASAQSAPGPRSAERGHELRAKALDAVAAGTRFEQAADRLIEEAQASRLENGEMARTLRLAGRLYHHAGAFDAARRALEAGAMAAYRAAQYRLAANLYLDAAEAASLDGDARGAWHAADLAGYVLRTTDLSVAARRQILSRVEYATAARDEQLRRG